MTHPAAGTALAIALAASLMPVCLYAQAGGTACRRALLAVAAHAALRTSV